jgi:para-nitrobenzyl esterase
MQGAGATGPRFVAASPCADATAVPACLRDLDVDTILRVLPPTVGVAATGENHYGPVIDGYVLPDAPLRLIQAGAHNHLPFAIGANADETSRDTPPIASEEQYRAALQRMFGAAVAPAVAAAYPPTDYGGPRQALIAATSDVRFICQARTAARAVAASQAEPVYRYFYTQALRGPLAASGAFHGLELAFVFGTLGAGGGYMPNDAERALSDAMVGYWSRFAATGDPNGDGAVAWPAYDVAADPYLRLGTPIAAGEGVRTAQCDFWERLAGGR